VEETVVTPLVAATTGRYTADVTKILTFVYTTCIQCPHKGGMPSEYINCVCGAVCVKYM